MITLTTRRRLNNLLGMCVCARACVCIYEFMCMYVCSEQSQVVILGPYSGGEGDAFFEFLLEHCLSWLMIFGDIPQCLSANINIAP
jgi:hypothetical protein